MYFTYCSGHTIESFAQIAPNYLIRFSKMSPFLLSIRKRPRTKCHDKEGKLIANIKGTLARHYLDLPLGDLGSFDEAHCLRSV